MESATQTEQNDSNDADTSDFWSEVKKTFGVEKDRTFLKAILGFSEKDNYATGIENSVWFHALYGFLDGISVVYSTIKFSCELISATSKDYHENLEHVLSDPEFWLPMVIAATISGATFSVLGNYAGKKDKDERNQVEEFCLNWLPYVRDILKGAKNGYKAIKTLAMVAVSHHLLNPANIRYVAMPIGLTFAITAIINRCFIRSIDDKQKSLTKTFKENAKNIRSNHQLHEDIQLKQTQQIDIDIALKPILERLDGPLRSRMVLDYMDSDIFSEKDKQQVTQLVEQEKALLDQKAALQESINQKKQELEKKITYDTFCLKMTLQTRLSYEQKLKEINAELAPLEKRMADDHYDEILLHDSLGTPDQRQAAKELKKKISYLKNRKEELDQQIALQETILALFNPDNKDIEETTLFKDKDELQQNYDLLYLIAKGLGGFIDAPYLYLGVMSLTILSFPALIFTSSILSLFVISCIAVRVHEGYCAQQELDIQALIAKVEIAKHAFNKKQTSTADLKYQLFQEFCKKPIYLGTPESEMERLFGETLYDNHLSQEYKTFHNALLELHALHQNVEDVATELQAAIKPTYWGTALHGMQDGLSAFGVLASTYFLLGIVLLGMGVAFPPALIAGGVFLGLVGIIAAVGLRLWDTQKELQKRDEHYTNWKGYIAEETKHALHDPRRSAALLLSPIDVNTDYLTKGEFFGQGLFEIARNFLNSPYKAENLTDFFLNQLDNSHSTIIAGFWAVLGIIYCGVLTLRAYGKTSKDRPANFTKEAEKEAEQHHNETKEARPKKMPGMAPKGIACLCHKWLGNETPEAPSTAPETESDHDNSDDIDNSNMSPI